MCIRDRATDTADDNMPAETAVMVTDEIDSDDELLELEQEAVEGALMALEEDQDEPFDDADVTIYTGLFEDDDGALYGAVVAAVSYTHLASRPFGGASPHG